jgi:group II intron reverse transcriptase/maturase
MSKSKPLKQQSLRNIEYYNMQSILDELYEKSKRGETFDNLMDYILLEDNIMLAYRNLKTNDGSYTSGIDGKNIKDLEILSKDELINLVHKRLKYYKPQEVKRVEIPKSNGLFRPLGIPTIYDRLIQQAILQIMEPIAEAKFYKNSYGFRPNRSVENAISATYKKINVNKLYFIVSVDIKSFFDNVNHKKLRRQLWTMGYQDKKLISIINEMLKAPIKLQDGTIILPTKGTPQGGILSPLLANIVLNELDWWIVDQWEEFPTKNEFKKQYTSTGLEIKSNMYRSLKKFSKLKELRIVRYADDFKIFCRTKEDAKNIFEGLKIWLSKRLKLEINTEKSNIVDVRKKKVEFLGFEIKAIKKGNKYIASSHISEKAMINIKAKIDERIKAIKKAKGNKEKLGKAIAHYNITVWGIHNFYKIATNINLDLAPLQQQINLKLRNIFKEGFKKEGELKETSYIYQKYGNSQMIRYIEKQAITPIAFIQHWSPSDYNPNICKYTKEGRELIHKNLELDYKMIEHLSLSDSNCSTQFIDNRVSLYAAQKGKCAITGEQLTRDNFHCHHKKAKKDGGSDEYDNLILIAADIHKLVHATKPETIEVLKKTLSLKQEEINKINKLRDALLLKHI